MEFERTRVIGLVCRPWIPLQARLQGLAARRLQSVVVVPNAAGKEFPSEHVDRVLGANVDFCEVREVLQGSEALVKYSVTMSPTASLVWLNRQLFAEGNSGLKSVSWSEPSKKG